MTATTLVVVMLAWTGQKYVPTLEFTTQAKCENAIVQMEKKMNTGDSWANKTTRVVLECVTIEK